MVSHNHPPMGIISAQSFINGLQSIMASIFLKYWPFCCEIRYIHSHASAGNLTCDALQFFFPLLPVEKAFPTIVNENQVQFIIDKGFIALWMPSVFFFNFAYFFKAKK
jgi:hypothetical protein